jgi:hypothetical protein
VSDNELRTTHNINNPIHFVINRRMHATENTRGTVNPLLFLSNYMWIWSTKWSDSIQRKNTRNRLACHKPPLGPAASFPLPLSMPSCTDIGGALLLSHATVRAAFTFTVGPRRSRKVHTWIAHIYIQDFWTA